MAEQIGLQAVLDTSNFTKGLGVYNRGIAEMNKGTSDFSSSANKALASVGKGIVNFGKIAAGAGVAGVAALGAGLATFAVGGIKQAATLDQKMADIAAVMGQTKDAVTPLKDEILKLSIDPQLRVNATQAAEAIELLARNGLNMTQILDGAAKSTVALANATGAEFGTAADIATDVMAVFNINANNMGRAVDGITGVTTHSKLTIDDYALALSSTGAVAQGMGVSLEDMNTVLAATASTFSSGRTAGTSLKVLLQRLAKPTDEMKAAMDKYGISLFDSEGNMRSMAEVAQQLNSVFQGTATITTTVGGVTKEMERAADSAAKKLPALNDTIKEQQTDLAILNKELPEVIRWYGEGSPAVDKHRAKILKLSNSLNENIAKQSDMQRALAMVANAREEVITSTKNLTQAEKAELAAVLGGADGSRQIIALSKLTADEFNNLSSEVNAGGQALKAAATRVDSISGAIDIFKSVIQSIQIQVGDKFLPIIKEMTVGFTDLATQAGPILISFFGSIADQISNFIRIGQALFTAFQTGGASGLVAALGLTPDTIELMNKISGSLQSLGNTILSVLLPGLSQLSGGGFLAVINAGITYLNDNFDKIQGTFLSFGATIGIVAGLIQSNWATIQAVFLTGLAVVQAVWAGIIAGLQPVMPAFEQISTAVASLGLTWGDVWNAILTATGIVAAGIAAAVVAIISVVIGLVSGIANAVASIITVWQEFESYLEQFVTGIVQIFQGQFLEGIVNVLQSLGGLLVTLISAPLRIVLSFIQGFVESVIGFWEGLYQSLVGGSIVPDLINSIVDWFTYLPDAILGVLGGLGETISGIFSSIFGGGEGEGGGLFIDPTLVLAGLEQINLFLIETIPASLLLLNEQFLFFFTTMTEQLNLLTFGPLTLFITTLSSIYLIHLPTLMATWTTATTQIIAQITMVIATLTTLISTIQTTQTTAVSMANAFASGMSRVASSITTAAQRITSKLIPAINKAIARAAELADNLERAARAARNAGSASAARTGAGFKRGIGFQAGTPGNTGGLLNLGYKIPQGFGGDSFPFFAQSGEEMLITPRGQSIEGLIFSRLSDLLRGSSVQGGSVTNNYYYNFNMDISTGADARSVFGAARVMGALYGA